MDNQDTLKKYRDKIDEIDKQLVRLFDERMSASLEIAKYKQKNNIPVLNRQRERQVLDKVSSYSRDDNKIYTRILYSEIFGLSRSYQRKYIDGSCPVSSMIKEKLENTPSLFPEHVKVACQGVEGAYSQQACDRIFRDPQIIYTENWEDVLKKIESGECRYGVLPIENSTAGSVNKVYDLMKKYKFFIIRSIRIHVDHSLLVNHGAKIEDIKEIFSHEQALSQCSEFINSLDNIKVTVVKNTAAAAKMVADSGRTDIAAIASSDCAELYNLQELYQSVQNVTNNYTRFICVSKNCEVYPGADRTSLMLTTAHKPGSLYSILTKLNAHRINMLKLESRPVPEKDFEFSFYFDIEISVYSDDLYAFFDELYNENTDFTYFGSYSEVL